MEDRLIPLSDGMSKESGLSVEELISAKHAEYTKATRLYRMLYYVTRFLAGLGAASVPFLLAKSADAASIASAMVCMCIIIDQVFDPKSRWARYSRAVDYLVMEDLKRCGKYEEFKNQLDAIAATESAQLDKLSDISEVLRAVRMHSGVEKQPSRLLQGDPGPRERKRK